MMVRRVVITGMGAVTPLGSGVNFVWDRLIRGDSGIRRIESFPVDEFPAKIAGSVPRGTGKGEFDVDAYVPIKDQRKMGDFIKFALAASQEALDEANWHPTTQEDQERTGVLIGAGIGGLLEISQNAITLENNGHRKVSPFFIVSSLINLASGQVGIRHNLKGPNHSVVTACASGNHAIGDAARLISFGDADVMVAGGAESALCPLGIAGFAAARALSTHFNETPERASRPWDMDRDGFVMGEGAGIMVLEEREHAKKRGAPILGEILGYGLTGDAHHITAPPDDGDGAYRAMKMALKNAGLMPGQIGYINAHGTSTPPGDVAELAATRRLMGPDLPKVSMSSTKSSIGHLLGAAGGVEAIFTALALRHGLLPPTLNLDSPCPEAEGIDLVPKIAKEKSIDYAISNSFGFGGTNASLVLGRFKD